MPKSFSKLTSNGFVPALVGCKTVIINTGVTPICVVDDDTNEAMKNLSEQDKKAVLESLFSIAPGSSKSLAAGSYYLELGHSLQSSAILFVESKETKKQPETQN